MKQKNILITCARSPVTLDLARHLKRAGHKIFVADPHKVHFTGFSNSIEKSFVIPSPTFKTKDFIDKLIHIAKKEKIDLLIPIFEEVIYIAKFRELFPKTCEIFCSSFETLHTLHNKWQFHLKLKSLNLLSPETQLIKSTQELESLRFSKTQILKPCYSRGATQIRKLPPSEKPPTIAIKQQNPWIAQEWLEGNKYCSYSICKNGKVLAHSLYPFLFNENHFCLRFESIDHPKILEWIQKFAELTSFTGHIAFDFIETDGKIYPLECNPRATFGFNLFELEDDLHRAFFEDLEKPIQPLFGRAKQVAAGMFVYGWRTILLKKNFRTFLKKLFSTKDITYNRKDLKPFFFQPIVFIAYLFRALRCRKNVIDLYLYDIEWNGESIDKE